MKILPLLTLGSLFALPISPRLATGDPVSTAASTARMPSATSPMANQARWTPQFVSFLGGSELDAASAIIPDAAGNFYVAGVTSSPNFPGTEKPTESKRGNAFLCKFSSSYQLLWTRFIGGNGFDQARGIALDKSGNVYLVGNCETGAIPLLNAPPLPHGQPCAFVARFSSEGELQMATQLGSSGWTYGQAITLDETGNLWIAGTMRGQRFPAKDATLAATGKTDVWISKLSPSGELLFSTLLGGNEDEALGALVAAPGGGVALTGTTASTNFPTANALQAFFGGAGSDGDVKGDAWVAVLDAEGKTRAATYFGGKGSDVGSGLAFAPNGDLWLTGFSESRDLPLKEALPKGDQPNGPFLARFKGDGSQLLQATYVPGLPRDGKTLNIEVDGSFWLSSGVSDYSNDGYQLTHLSAGAMQVMETIPWPNKKVNGLARGSADTFYFVGNASLSLATRRALLTSYSGNYDGFVAVLKKQAPPSPTTKPITITVDAPTSTVIASGTTNIGLAGEVQVMLYRSADSKYWTGMDWSTKKTWVNASVSGERWMLRGLAPGPTVLPGDYYVHAVAIAGAELEDFLGPEYSEVGRAKASRKIVIAPR